MVLCGKCNVAIGMLPYVTCFICTKFFHYTTDCSGLSGSELKVVELKRKSSLIYACKTCLDSSDINKVIDFQTIKSDLDEIKHTLSALTVIKLEVDNIKKDITSLQNVAKDIPNLKNQISEIELKVDKAHNASILPGDKENIITELLQRSARANNLVFFNLNETLRTEDDTAEVKSLINHIGIDTSTITTRRIGKHLPGKTRPVLVTFKSSYDVRTVFMNKLKIRSPIKVAYDRTPQQQLLYKEAIAILKEKTAAGEKDLYIKFVNNVPTVTKKNDPHSSNSHSKN